MISGFRAVFYEALFSNEINNQQNDSEDFVEIDGYKYAIPELIKLVLERSINSNKAIIALGKIKDEMAIHVIADCLESQFLRKYSIDALITCDRVDLVYEKFWSFSNLTKLYVVKKIEKNEKNIMVFIDGLNSNDQELINESRKSLLIIGKKAIPSLFERMDLSNFKKIAELIYDIDCDFESFTNIPKKYIDEFLLFSLEKDSEKCIEFLKKSRMEFDKKRATEIYIRIFNSKKGKWIYIDKPRTFSGY